MVAILDDIIMATAILGSAGMGLMASKQGQQGSNQRPFLIPPGNSAMWPGGGQSAGGQGAGMGMLSSILGPMAMFGEQRRGERKDKRLYYITILVMTSHQSACGTK